MHEASENLWYGDVRPQVCVNTPEMNKALEQVEKIRTCLCRTLTDEQKEQIKAFAGVCKESNYGKKSGFFKRIFEKFNKK